MKTFLPLALALTLCLSAQAQTRNGALPVITSIGSAATFPVTTDNGLNDWKISLDNLVSSLGVGFGATNAIAGNLTSGVVPKAGTTGTNLVDGPIVISAVTNAALTGVFRANAIISTNAITGLSLTTTTNVTAAAYTITGTTNQVTFGATNTAPSSAVAPTKWISVTVTGDAGVYRVPRSDTEAA